MCTVFQMKDKNLIGKNYDAFTKGGMIFTNKRGIKKSALIMPPSKPLMWKSVYGSITFSQNGKEMPISGMNEEGLVVEQATLPECEYRENNQNQPLVGCLEMIQYILDTCSNLEEALDAFEVCLIEKNAWPIHFMIGDHEGKMAIVEFLQGKMKIFREGLDKRIITNSPYEVSCQSLERDELERDEYSKEDAYKKNSIERFKIGSQLLEQSNAGDVQTAFEILNQVKREDTQWQIVSDTKAKCLYFKGKESASIRSLSLAEIDFSKEAQSMQLDFIKTEKTELEPFSFEDNRRLIEEFYNNEQIKSIMHIPDANMIINFIAGQAEKYENQ